MPHAWLNRCCPEEPISTVDLAGRGGFTLLTGIGGAAWKEAAGAISKAAQADITPHVVGFGQEWVDVYSDWEKIRGVNESGAILVRLDRFVAWRCQGIIADVQKREEKLLQVMKSILGLAV